LAERLVGGFNDDAEAVNKIRPELRRLDGFWSELSNRRDKPNPATVRPIGRGIGHDLDVHPRVYTAEIRFPDVSPNPDGLIER
jgi:hypothetical protein